MKKSNLVKLVLVLGVILITMLVSTTVMAANDTGFTDITETLNNSTANNTNTTNTNTNTSLNISTNNTNTNKTNNTNSTSIYNNTSTNTNLPKTGISDSIPVALLIVLFVISSVYAYKKVNDYKNI